VREGDPLVVVCAPAEDENRHPFGLTELDDPIVAGEHAARKPGHLVERYAHAPLETKRSRKSRAEDEGGARNTDAAFTKVVGGLASSFGQRGGGHGTLVRWESKEGNLPKKRRAWDENCRESAADALRAN
jgi:hypothetical protein